MSKSKIPTLPPNARRPALVSFRDQVRTYARREFEKGSTPEAVYEQVAPNGQLWALRASIDGEYLAFLGVPRKQARLIEIGSAMATYFVLSGFEPPSSIVLHYAVPVIVAIFVGRGVEVLVTGYMRSRREKQRKSQTVGVGK